MIVPRRSRGLSRSFAYQRPPGSQSPRVAGVSVVPTVAVPRRVISSRAAPVAAPRARGASRLDRPAPPARHGAGQAVGHAASRRCRRWEKPGRAAPAVGRPPRGEGAGTPRKTTLLGRGVRHLVDLCAAPSEDAWGWALRRRSGADVARHLLQPARPRGQSASRGKCPGARLGRRRGAGGAPVGGVVLLAGRARRGLGGVLVGARRSCSSLPPASATWRRAHRAISAPWLVLGGAGGVVGAGVGGGLAKVDRRRRSGRSCSEPSPSRRSAACSACRCCRSSGGAARALGAAVRWTAAYVGDWIAAMRVSRSISARRAPPPEPVPAAPGPRPAVPMDSASGR